jgi:hypothetical protein
MQRFSDTFIFFSKLHNDDHDMLLSPLLAYLGCLSILIITLLDRKIVLRGSICYGTGWETSTNHCDFYGYALARAHYLESKKANYPRIIIDKKLYELFTDAAGEKFNINPLIKNIAKECLMLCYKDFDGEIALDYLGEYMAHGLSACGKIGLSAEKIKTIYPWITMQKEHFQNSSNQQEQERLYPKYQKLEAYFESRLHYWGLR